jgi:DNA-directed RNA polymerase subunit beta
MNKLFTNNIGDLAEAQRASFYRFLSKGISEELANFPNPFLAKIKVDKKYFKGRKRLLCLVFLNINEIKLKGPNYNLLTCLKKDLSYTIQFYVAGEYSFTLRDKNIKTPQTLPKKIRVKQDILFGEIPLITEEGTFVISGCERVVISQIIRSPGIYFRKEFGNSRKVNYTATIISNKGLWTKIVLDESKLSKEEKAEGVEAKDLIYIKLNDFRGKNLEVKKKADDNTPEDLNRLFLFDLIYYFGLSREDILDLLKYPLHFTNQKVSAEFSENLFTNPLSNSQYNFQTQEIDTSENLESNFKASYTLEKNYKHETSLLIKKFFFNQRSGCFSIGEIGRYKINKKLGLNLPKDITYLTPYDFIGIIDGLIELKYYDRVSDDIDDIKNKQIRCIGELLQGQIKIGLAKLQKSLIEQASSVADSQKVNFDLENYSDPEEWIIDPRPITNTVRDFFKTSQLSQFMDQINPLAELTHKRRISVFGPNGLKRDHISVVIRDIHPSQYGRLCPIETPEGQNAGLIMSTAMFGRISSLGSVETPYFFMNEGKVFSETKPVYLNPEQESETIIAFGDISLSKTKNVNTEYISIKENNLFSVKKVTDVNFITTSPIQIVSLATALIPFLEHDDANRALMGSNMQRQAVPLLYTQKPLIGTGLESAAILDSGMIIKSYSEGSVEFSSSHSIKIKDSSDQIITYYLRKYTRSNQETCINQRPIVWCGEKVFSGQIIADGPGTNDGELSLGKNLTIAYMPWEGYNYEDAIVLNERVILEDYLTSIHIEEHETTLSYSVIGKEKLTKDLPHLTKYIRRNLDKCGVIKIGSYIKEHDILIGKLTPCEEDSSAEAKLVRALYNIKNKNLRDSSLRVPHGTEGRVIDVRILSTSLLNKEEVIPTGSQIFRIYIAQIRKIQIGDKLAGRHGNKGIISRILPQQDMPYLPDGTPVDIIFNPLGVPSRMNVGQVFECLLGFAGEKLGSRFKVAPFDEIYGNEASRILTNQKLKQAAIKTDSSWIFNPYYPGKILLRDGRTGEYFDNPITVGKSYILKLVHLVEDKIHARATGPYSMITEQPLAGKSQKGGQRFGEMEVWALEAYGCSNTLQELLTIKSDDIDGRNDMYESILSRKEIEKPTPSIPEAFLALVRELNALGLDFTFKKFEGGIYSTTDIKEVEKDIFNDIETRLMLRSLLARKKAEEFGKSSNSSTKKDIFGVEKLEEKNKVLERFNEPYYFE